MADGRLCLLKPPLPRYQNVIKCSGFRNLKNEIPIQTRDHSVHAVQKLSIGFTTVKSFFLKVKSNNCIRTGMVLYHRMWEDILQGGLFSVGGNTLIPPPVYLVLNGVVPCPMIVHVVSEFWR